LLLLQNDLLCCGRPATVDTNAAVAALSVDFNLISAITAAAAAAC
jgi:hypothetical protein